MLSAANYQNIVCELEKAIVAGSNAYSKLISAISIVNNSGLTASRTGSLLDQLDKTIIQLYNIGGAFPELVSFARALNAHIVEYYGNFSVFLSTYKISIPVNTAVMFNSIGYSVPVDNIYNCSSMVVNSFVAYDATIGPDGNRWAIEVSGVPCYKRATWISPSQMTSDGHTLDPLYAPTVARVTRDGGTLWGGVVISSAEAKYFDILDFEPWMPAHTKNNVPVSWEEDKINLQTILAWIDAYRNEWPEAVIGFYPTSLFIPPDVPYYSGAWPRMGDTREDLITSGPYRSTDFSQSQQLAYIERMKEYSTPLIEKLDYLAPDFYLLGRKEIERDFAFFESFVNIFSSFNKPIYPFIWGIWHSAFPYRTIDINVTEITVTIMSATQAIWTFPQTFTQRLPDEGSLTVADVIGLKIGSLSPTSISSTYSPGITVNYTDTSAGTWYFESANVNLGFTGGGFPDSSGTTVAFPQPTTEELTRYVNFMQEHCDGCIVWGGSAADNVNLWDIIAREVPVFIELSSSSSSSFNNESVVLNVSRLSSTDIAWTFNVAFTNESFEIEELVTLLVGEHEPIEVISVASPIIILKYPDNNATTWSVLANSNIVFIDGSNITEDTGTII